MGLIVGGMFDCGGGCAMSQRATTPGSEYGKAVNIANGANNFALLAGG